MVDICRDPRWGRIAEGSGEDPYLGSVMARAYIRGYQGDDMTNDSTLMACVKHFALYGAAEGGRDYNAVDMSRANMFNYYLTPLHQHATSSGWLLNDVLRSDWAFNGLVVTDYGSVPEVATMGCASENDAAVVTIKAGTDMDMVSGLFVNTLEDALHRGAITEKWMDDACLWARRSEQQLRLLGHSYTY